MAMEAEGPAALLLSRQNITDIPAKPESTRYNDALGAEKGAYIVSDYEGAPDCILLANGSEVSTMVECAKILKDKGYAIRIVSAPSEGVFSEQSSEYRESVLPFGVPVLGLTAGLPAALQGLAGPLGKVIGMKRFGASAPYKVLDEKFGYTPESVADQAERYLKEFNEIIRKLSSMISEPQV